MTFFWKCTFIALSFCFLVGWTHLVEAQQPSTSSFYVSAEPTTTTSGGTSLFTFIAHSTAVSARLYLTCPIGVTMTAVGGGGEDLCNQWITFNRPFSKKVIFTLTNTVPALQTITADFYEYMPDNPTFARTATTRLTVQSKNYKPPATITPVIVPAGSPSEGPITSPPQIPIPAVSPSSSPVVIPLPTVAPETGACVVFRSTLQMGSRGAEVIALQTWLLDNGYDIPDLSSGLKKKGLYAGQTAEAVKKYQTDSNIKVTGSVGTLTRAKLNEQCGIAVSPSDAPTTATPLVSAPSSSTPVSSVPPVISSIAPTTSAIDQSVTWKFVRQSVSMDPGTPTQASSIVGTIVLEATPRGGSMKRPIASDFSVIFKSGTDIIEGVSAHIHKGIMVTPTAASLGEEGKYTVTIVGSMMSSHPRFSCVLSGKPIYMVLKNADARVGEKVIVNQALDANEFRTQPASISKNIGCTVTSTPATTVSVSPTPSVTPVITPKITPIISPAISKSPSPSNTPSVVTGSAVPSSSPATTVPSNIPAPASTYIPYVPPTIAPAPSSTTNPTASPSQSSSPSSSPSGTPMSQINQESKVATVFNSLGGFFDWVF